MKAHTEKIKVENEETQYRQDNKGRKPQNYDGLTEGQERKKGKKCRNQMKQDKVDKENAETKGGLLHASGDDTVIEDNGIKFKKLAEMERQNVRASR